MDSKKCKERIDVMLCQIASGNIGGKWREIYDELGSEKFGCWIHGYCMGAAEGGGSVTLPDYEVHTKVQNFSMN